MSTRHKKTVIAVLNEPIKDDSFHFNSSDGRVIRASAFGVVESRLLLSPIKPMTSKLVFTTSLLNGQCGEQAGKFTYSVVGKDTKRDCPILGVVNPRPTIPKRARYSHLNAFS